MPISRPHTSGQEMWETGRSRIKVAGALMAGVTMARPPQRRYPGRGSVSMQHGYAGASASMTTPTQLADTTGWGLAAEVECTVCGRGLGKEIDCGTGDVSITVEIVAMDAQPEAGLVHVG